MAHDHYRTLVERSEPADHCRIIGKAPVTVHLGEIGEESLNIVKGMGSLRVPRQEHAPPRVLRDFSAALAEALQLVAQPVNLLARGNRLGFAFELSDLTLKILRDSAFPAG